MVFLAQLSALTVAQFMIATVKLILLGILALIITSGLFYIHSLKNDNFELSSQKAVLEQQITNQNQAIETMRIDSLKRETAGALLVQEASKAAQIHTSSGKTIYKTLPSSTDDCKSALSLLQ